MCCLNECLTSEINTQQSSFFIRISEMESGDGFDFFCVAAASRRRNSAARRRRYDKLAETCGYDRSCEAILWP
jgi:hypothetical protein